MTPDIDPESPSALGEPISRRTLLRGGLATAAGALAAGAYSGSAGAAARSTKLTSTDLSTIRQFMGSVDLKFAGKGETWKIGGAFPFSTSGSVYGLVMSNGAKLAVDHIKQLGGPNIVIDFRDFANLDAVKTRNAFIAYQSEGLGAVLSSEEAGGYYAADILKAGHMLAIDPGGGNAPPGNGVPYFWGMRANWGYSGWTLATTYFTKKLKKTKIVIVSYNVIPSGYITQAKANMAAAGGQVVNVIESAAPGATDYSDVLTAIRSSGDFDVISLGIDGLDIANFLRQYKTSGIGKPIITWDGLLSPTLKAAGTAAYEGIYLGGTDAFSVTNPNPWAQVFVKSYRATFGTNGFAEVTPDYYSAGYYDATFLLWRLYRDVKRNGGDVNNGTQLQAALVENPTTPVLFGGTAHSAGKAEFDTVSHGLLHQPMAFYRVHNGAPVTLATSDINGVDIKFVR